MNQVQLPNFNTVIQPFQDSLCAFFLTALLQKQVFYIVLVVSLHLFNLGTLQRHLTQIVKLNLLIFTIVQIPTLR